MRTSLPPTAERDRDSVRGRDRGRDREGIDDKISQTRSRSHLLLALPSIVAIICLSVPHTPHTLHTGTHTSTDANTDMNASANAATSTGVSTGTRTSSDENVGVQRLRSAACHAVSRVNMSALVESYNDLEERAKNLKAENTQLHLEINNLQSNAANLPF